MGHRLQGLPKCVNRRFKMNSIVEEKVKLFLVNRLKRPVTECGAILFNMRSLAKTAGFGLNAYFGQAGLAAGPDARVAAGVVNRALGGGGGDVVAEGMMNRVLDRWVLTTPGMGA
jgi:hypothetical protein